MIPTSWRVGCGEDRDGCARDRSPNSDDRRRRRGRVMRDDAGGARPGRVTAGMAVPSLGEWNQQQRREEKSAQQTHAAQTKSLHRTPLR